MTRDASISLNDTDSETIRLKETVCDSDAVHEIVKPSRSTYADSLGIGVATGVGNDADEIKSKLSLKGKVFSKTELSAKDAVLCIVNCGRVRLLPNVNGSGSDRPSGVATGIRVWKGGCSGRLLSTSWDSLTVRLSGSENC